MYDIETREHVDKILRKLTKKNSSQMDMALPPFFLKVRYIMAPIMRQVTDENGYWKIAL